MTAVDGYQIARRGAPRSAQHSAIGSFLAERGAVAALVSSPAAQRLRAQVQCARILPLAALGITASASLGSGSAIKALMAAVLGLMAALVGVDPCWMPG